MTSFPSDQHQLDPNQNISTTMNNNNSEQMEETGTSRSPRELGIIEKLCSTYGFVYCCHRDGRYFFHFSEYKSDIQQAKIGDVVEFETTIDKRKQKPIAINIIPTSPEIIGENRVEGTIAVIARQPHPNGLNLMPDGKVSYVKKGETYFLPYSLSDLQNSTMQVKTGDQVTFNVGQDRRTNQFFARNILLVDKPTVASPPPPPPPTAVKRYRGVVSTMKDSFGFIERDDVLKEIFFHITEFGSDIPTNTIQPGVEVEFDIQNRLNKDVACNIVVLPRGTVQFDEVDKTPYIGRILQPLQVRTKKSGEPLSGRLIYDTSDKKMAELPFGERDRCGLYTILENDIVQFFIAKDKRDGMSRATRISLLDQSFLKSKEQREIGMVIKLDNTSGGQIKCLTSNEIISFRFNEIMKDDFQISQGDLMEFSLALNQNNGNIPQAVRIKLLSKEQFAHEIRCQGIIHEDHRDTRAGVIRYLLDGIESTIEYLASNVNNKTTLYLGDKVEFTSSLNSKYATDVTLIERNRLRGWIAIIRENRGFIEQNNFTDKIEPIAFVNENLQVELGDEVEFSLRKHSNQLLAENILQVPSTIQNLYSVLPTIYHGRVVSPVRMITNDECEILGRIQKLTDEGIPGECYMYSITGTKNKRVILLPNDSVTFSVAVGLNYTKRAVNIVLDNEVRKGKVDTVKGQFGFIDFTCEENKKIFFHHSEVDGGYELRPGDEVEFYAQYNLKSGKPCANKVRRINHLQRPDRLISKLKSMNIDPNKGQKLIIVRQPRNADEKSKGFTHLRIEREPGVLVKNAN